MRSRRLPGNELHLQDTVRNLKHVVATLKRIEDSETKQTDSYSHECKYILARDAEKTLKTLLGEPQPAPQAQPTRERERERERDEQPHPMDAADGHAQARRRERRPRRRPARRRRPRPRPAAPEPVLPGGAVAARPRTRACSTSPATTPRTSSW